MAKRNAAGVALKRELRKKKQGATHARGKVKPNSGTGSAFNKGKASSNPYRADPSGGKPGSQFRTRATINRLNMYRAKPDMKKMKARPTDPAAVGSIPIESGSAMSEQLIRRSLILTAKHLLRTPREQAQAFKCT